MIKLKRKYKKCSVSQSYKFDGAYIHDWGIEYIYSHKKMELSNAKPCPTVKCGQELVELYNIPSMRH